MPGTSASHQPPQITLEILAGNVKRLRGEVGWSTRAFSEHVGINLGTLYRIESAAYGTVSLATLERLARGLGVHPTCLITQGGDARVPFPEVPIQDALAENILEGREERKLTQDQLATRAQVDRTVIAKIERRTRNPSLQVLERIANALDKSLGELLKTPTK